MLDLEPPKPTKEFHEAYMEIYGRAKKKEDKKEPAKQTLADLDLPPLKLDIPELTLPDLRAAHSLNTPQQAEKKPLFSFLKKEKKAPDIELPALKPAPSLAVLDEPPQKIPPFTQWNIGPVAKEIKPLEKKKPVHDFLAEIKKGSKKSKPLLEIQAEEHLPIFDEHTEGLFEKSLSTKGARDVQFAFEKTHPFETAGHEFLEKIQPLKKPLLSVEEPEEMPRVQKFKSPAEYKQYMKRAKEYESTLKKIHADAKKTEQTIKIWLKKQQMQDLKLTEKMKKMQQMEQELLKKQEDAKNYEPRLKELYTREDAILEKERELKLRQEDIHDTEQRLRIEENSIVASVKRLEADQKLLEKEQDAITKTVAKMEKEKSQIAVKTKEFAQIMKDISSAEQELKEKIEMFTDRDEAIKRKERMIEKEVARVEALKKKAEKLKDMEQTYERMKKRLRTAYQEYEEKFLNKETYTQKEVLIEPTVRAAEQPNISLEAGDITNLITATKQLIIDKKYEDANRHISKLMQRYLQIPENNPRKKEIYYDILSVKNMLKLDLLE